MLYLSPWPHQKDFRYFLRTTVGDLSVDKNVEKLVEVIFKRGEPLSGITGSFWRFRKMKAFDEELLKKRVRERILDSDRSLGAIFKAIIEETTIYNGYDRCSVTFPSSVPELSPKSARMVSELSHHFHNPRSACDCDIEDQRSWGDSALQPQVSSAAVLHQKGNDRFRSAPVHLGFSSA